MTKLTVGLVVGGVLGLLDGLSSWFYPEARPMIITIVIVGAVVGFATQRFPRPATP